MLLKGEQIEMLRLLFPGGQQYVMEEWVVDFADGEMKRMMWKKILHYQILWYVSWPFSFRVEGTL